MAAYRLRDLVPKPTRRDLAERAVRAHDSTVIRQDVGCATIVIDHDLRFINRLCDRLCVMDQGQVIMSGETSEVWRDPRVVEVYVGQSQPA